MDTYKLFRTGTAHEKSKTS